MKATTDESEDAFSGKTVPIDVPGSEKTRDEIITYTRKHYATPKVMVKEYLEKLFKDEPKKKPKKIKKVISKTIVKISPKLSKEVPSNAQKMKM